MKTLVGTFLVLILAFSACSSQVTVPVANLQPVLDTLANMRAQAIALQSRLATLEARPQIVYNGKEGYFLDGTGAFVKATEVKTGSVTFADSAWQKTVYIPGINSTWTFSVWPHYATKTPTVDFPYPFISRDSLTVVRQRNGTANLAVDYLGVLP